MPSVPAPTASDVPRNERRLIKRFRGLTLFSKFSSKGRFSLLLESFAVGSLIVFMPIGSQQLTLRALFEKLRVCYLTGCSRSHVIQPNKCFSPPATWSKLDTFAPLRSRLFSDQAPAGRKSRAKCAADENVVV